MKNSACVITLGCKANQFESAAIEKSLCEAGYQLYPFSAGAQLVVINTCTVTAATDAQSRKLVRRAHRLNPDCRIVVTGCYAQIAPNVFADYSGVELIIGNMEKQNFIELLHGADSGKKNKIHVGDIAKATACPDLQIASFPEHSRAFVQIQSGCDAFCSYCVIPFARGRSRSVKLAEVVAQINTLVKNGYHEVVLTGIHIGNYGQDFTPQLALSDLINAILKQTKLHRLRLGSIEPQELSDELIDLVTQNQRICNHFHIPLQSGSNSVLQRMNRHYTTDQFKRCIQRIVNAEQNVALGIDLITGFPGESDAEHQATVEFVSNMPITYLHVFPYSKRPGTVAAKMVDHIPAFIAKERAAQLRHVGDNKKQQYTEMFIDKQMEVVFENRRSNDGWKGISDRYVAVLLATDLDVAGQCLSVYGAMIENDMLRVKIDG